LTEREQYLGQIDRLANSHALHGSESLCKLLRYLAKHALDHPGSPIKEYQIATEVFGRPDDFDPQLDSTVRVQAGRLRQKLSDYYNSDGAEDAVVVDLPKGTYVLSLHHKAATAARPHSGPPAEGEWAAVGPRQSYRNWIIVALSLALLLAACAAAVLSLIANRNSAQAGLARDAAAPAAFRVFWNGFVSGQEEPWVIFSNAAFVGRPETGMRYYDNSRDKGSLIMDHYTGVGEVLAVHELDRVFDLLHRQIRVKRGSLFSLDDAKNNNLIFIGSPSENLTLLEIPGTHEFVFQRMTSGARKGDQAIINVHPQPGEAKEFYATPGNVPLTEDYAVIGRASRADPCGEHHDGNASSCRIRLPAKLCRRAPAAAPGLGERTTQTLRSGYSRQGDSRRARRHRTRGSAQRDLIIWSVAAWRRFSVLRRDFRVMAASHAGQALQPFEIPSRLLLCFPFVATPNPVENVPVHS
jgi:hypothetical protein